MDSIWIQTQFFFFFSIGILELIRWQLARLKRKSRLNHRGVTLLVLFIRTVSIHLFPYCLLKDSPLDLESSGRVSWTWCSYPPPAPWVPTPRAWSLLPGQGSRCVCRGTCTLVWDLHDSLAHACSAVGCLDSPPTLRGLPDLFLPTICVPVIPRTKLIKAASLCGKRPQTWLITPGEATVIPIQTPVIQ